VTEDTTPNVFYGIVTERENTIQAGAIFRYDARSAADPTRVDEESASFSIYSAGVPTSDAPAPNGRYRSPVVLPDGRLMVSWSDGAVNEENEFALTPPDYGIYIYNPNPKPHQARNSLIVNHEDTWEIYARPVVARTEPQAIPARQDTVDAAVPAILGSIDVRQTSLYARHGERVSGAQFDDTAMDEALTQATRVRIIEGFSSEAAPGVTMFGLTMAEGAAMLGEARVNEDGSWLAEVPPYVPIHLQPVDRFDLAIRNQTTWIQGMPGESRVCGGCHEDRTTTVNPSQQMLSIAAGNGPERFNVAVAERTEFPWWNANVSGNPNEIQALLDSRCVSCHNETMNGSGAQEFYTVTMTDALSGETTAEYQIPRLDLSSRVITVTYDDQEQSLPASYVSLFYPAALSMEMGDGAMVTGTVPPRWAIPSDARGSKLIEKLNVTAENDASEYAWELGTAIAPDEENGAVIAGGVHTDHAAAVGMTRDELVKLIRTIDMGGQYYSRQNTDFQPYAADPVGGGTQY
jgi:hypothetical protein